MLLTFLPYQDSEVQKWTALGQRNKNRPLV